jgi:hypothetical protein
LVIAKRKTDLRDVLIAICSVFKSRQADLNRIGARPLELQFPHWSVRSACLLARVAPTTPTLARRLVDASVDPTEARWTIGKVDASPVLLASPVRIRSTYVREART